MLTLNFNSVTFYGLKQTGEEKDGLEKIFQGFILVAGCSLICASPGVISLLDLNLKSFFVFNFLAQKIPGMKILLGASFTYALLVDLALSFPVTMIVLAYYNSTIHWLEKHGGW